jgi:hypothetical protein
MAPVPAPVRCRLLGGLFASCIQASLALLCIAMLVVKRQYEHPRRDWYVWFLDVMKQGMGSSFGHFSNIYLSQVIAYTISDADECQWYCFTYIVDCTFGTAINLFFLRIFERMVEQNPVTSRIFRFGDYGDPPQLTIFFVQLVVWLLIVTSVKLLILTTLLNFLLPINSWINYIFTGISDNAELELIVVMILVPTLLNSVQFWVTDTFLKKHFTEGELTAAELNEDLIEDREDSGKYESSISMQSQRLGGC